MDHFTPLLAGESPELQAVLRAAGLVAATDVPVLVGGESGTGKELLARALHNASPRAAGPFVSVNCAAMPEGLAESLLFGHRKGAFTGAVADNAGYLPTADGGTLFLDEVGELPVGVQAKLLRALESGECHPVGQPQPVHVNVRIIAATHRDLYDEVRAGRFREDLYYRLNVVPLELPPLRQRSGDLVLLLDRFNAELARHYGLEAPRYAPDALKALAAYRWPGNVRELRNFCERMVVLLAGRRIGADNLPAEIRSGNASPAAGGFTLPADGIRLAELEVDMIHQALTRTGGNRSRAARLLGLSRDTLLYRMKKYAIG